MAVCGSEVMMLPLLIFAAIMFALLYFQTGQGPLDACLWLLLRLRAAVVMIRWVASHLGWWVPANWSGAMSEARNENRVIEVQAEPLVRRWWES